MNGNVAWNELYAASEAAQEAFVVARLAYLANPCSSTMAVVDAAEETRSEASKACAHLSRYMAEVKAADEQFTRNKRATKLSYRRF